jgi:hypothetical protein
MSFTRTVPAAVPSLRHSSPSPLKMTEDSAPSASVGAITRMSAEIAGRAMSRRREVPAGVPSVTYNPFRVSSPST